MLYILKNACTFAPEFKIKPNMKDKIFNALKQEYARLGLGDNILLGLAEMLAGTSLVTEENLQGCRMVNKKRRKTGIEARI